MSKDSPFACRSPTCLCGALAVLPSLQAVAYLDFQCPAAYASPESSVATRLVVKLADDYLNELTYPAELAGLSYHLHNTLTGFQVRAVKGCLSDPGQPRTVQANNKSG